MVHKILITGARSAVALDMARNFHDIGYEVHMADCSSAYICKLSKIPKYVHHYTPPHLSPEQFIMDMQGIIGSIKPDLVIPTCEEVFYVSLLHDIKNIPCKIFSPSLSDLRRLHDKYQFIKFCEKIGVNTPETSRLDSKQDVERYKNTSQQWVFKPCYSRFGAEAIISPKPDELEDLSFKQKTSWVAQKYINGIEMSFYAVSQSGKLTALSVYKSSWRLKGGASYAFENVSDEIFVNVQNIAEKIALNLNLTGQFACDFIQDINGEIWLIECNPRCTSGLHLLKEKIAYAILGNDAGISTNTGVSGYMLPMMMTYGVIESFKKNKFKLWLDTIKSGQDVISAPEDRLPLLGALIDTIIFMMRGIYNRISLSQATTADIEWNGEELR